MVCPCPGQAPEAHFVSRTETKLGECLGLTPGWGLAQGQLLLEAQVRWNAVDTQYGVLRALISQPSRASNTWSTRKRAGCVICPSSLIGHVRSGGAGKETGPVRDSLAIMSLTMACLLDEDPHVSCWSSAVQWRLPGKHGVDLPQQLSSALGRRPLDISQDSPRLGSQFRN